MSFDQDKQEVPAIEVLDDQNKLQSLWNRIDSLG